MKIIRHITLAAAIMAALAFVPSLAQNNRVVPKAYMFGFVASFTDSVVFFTDIQEVDSVWLMPRKKMLAGKSNYSYQLRNFCADSLGFKNRTVVVVSALTRKEIEKKYAKMKKDYTVKRAGQYDVHYIDDRNAHLEAIKSVVSEVANEEMDKQSNILTTGLASISTMLTINIADSYLKSNLIIRDHTFYNIGYINYNDDLRMISFGILNHVFTLDKETAKEIMKEKSETLPFK